MEERTILPKQQAHFATVSIAQKQAVCEAVTICHRPLQVDLWPFVLKMVSESRVTWATSVSILVFLGLSVLDLGPTVRDRQTSSDVRRASSLNVSALWGRRHKNRM